MPPAMCRALRGWHKLSCALWQQIQRRQKANSASRKDAEETEDGQMAKMEGHQQQQQTEAADTEAALVHCELCAGQFQRPIGLHMRQRHPGCGGPSRSYGYNSAGQWTTGWSGNCGDGGQGNAVWYLLCAQCRHRYLQRGEADADGANSANDTLPMAKRLKRNAKFLLELNRDERTPPRQGHGQLPTIDVAASVSAWNCPTNAKAAGAGKSSGSNRWHSSDPGGHGQEAVMPHFAGSNCPQSPPCSASASANLFASPESDSADGSTTDPLLNAIVGFVCANHHLAAMRRHFRRSLIRAVSFGFAFRLWNWLIKLTTVEQCYQDIVWHFLSALGHFTPALGHSPSPSSSSFISPHPILPHPAQLCLLAGQLPVGQMVQQFHALLQRLAHFLQVPPTANPNGISTAATTAGGDAPLRSLCFRAWTFQLTGHEQVLLPTIRSLLSAVGNVLAGSSTDTNGTGISNNSTTESTAAVPIPTAAASLIRKSSSNGVDPATTGGICQIQALEDLTDLAHLEASSRPQLLACLVDGSCETFWESGEEDRGGPAKPRKLLLNWPTMAMPKLVAIYLDNPRDEAFRVDRIMAAKGGGGTNANETEANADGRGKKQQQQLILMDTQVDKNFCGWLKFTLNAVAGQCIEICLWGDDMGCRVRQLRLFGHRSQPTMPTGGGEGGGEMPQKPKFSGGAFGISGSSSIRPSNSQQQLLFGGGAQGDAFALFQSLATQMFGDDEFGGGSGGAGGTDTANNGGTTLREQVMDMLFSRSQLQPLQSFVGTHVSNALQREVANLRTKRKRHFSYVSALLQMLTRMCSIQPPCFIPDSQLMAILSQLWLFCPEMVRTQALEAAAKLLAQFRPADGSGNVKGGEMDATQLVEHLLAIVAKAITIQIKEKKKMQKGGKCQAEKHTISSHLLDAPSAWCLAECPRVNLDSAHLAIRILRQIPPQWHAQLRSAMVVHLLGLSSLLQDSLANGRPLAESIRCTQFWLTLATVATMDGPEWLEKAPEYQKLKAAKHRAHEPLCENHDDGRTRAQLRCQNCGGICLCRECFAVLHLSRRNQSHRARLVGSALAPLPRADFHEGCHRLRIGQQLLVLLNPKSLAGLVELGDGLLGPSLGRSPSSLPSASSSMSSFRKTSQQHQHDGGGGGQLQRRPTLDNGNGEEGMEECREESGEDDEAEDEGEEGEEEEEQEDMQESSRAEEEEAKCRFCGTPLAQEQVFTGICDFEECRQKQPLACQKALQCGHWCAGINGEAECPPCLHCQSGNRQDADDLCAICLSERLGESPCLQLLQCRHIFHWHCLRTGLEKRWPGPRISFRFMQCPLCKAQIDHPALGDLLAPLRDLQVDVARKARMRLEYEGVGEAAGTSTAPDEDKNAFLDLALAKFMYVQCSRCARAYFGGDARCQQQLEESGLAERAFDPAELICGGCAAEMAGTGAGHCGRHGADFLEFKCRFCCSVAIYFCFGSTHFCAGCHGDFQRLMGLPKHALPKCPTGPRGQQLADGEQCPLGMAHPPAGEEFALGCGICRNLHTF